ncbi:uroporphyrinogen decarboxylase family protein [Candidatus Latescibacterota bacterium]
MTHRDRVITALNHETPDRCPMQISFTPEFAERLRNDLNIAGNLHNPHGGGNTYELEIALGEDMLLTSVGWANSYYMDSKEYTDEWGVTFKLAEYETNFGTGKYTEMAGFPLAEDSAVETYVPPDPNRPELYTDAEYLINNFKDEYFITGLTVTTIFETAWALRGLSTLLMDFITNPELAERIIDIPYQYHLTAAKRLVEMGVDMIWTGDDFGTQNGMIISPDTWRTFFKPRMAEFFSSLREINPDIKIAYHSDGNIEPIIPDLIEIGLDVLNPVQPACMDPEKIKIQYGDTLCFWGTVDEQHTLPYGSPDDVKKEIITRLKTVGKNGGFIIGPTHHVQLDTPLENFHAMHDTILNTPYSNL